MTTLRVLLLLVGAAFIAGVWWWSRREQRVRGAIRSRRVERLPPQPTAMGEYSYDQDDEDLDIAGTLADLSGLVREGREERVRRPPEDATSRKRIVRGHPPQQLDMGFSEDSIASHAASATPLPERIIALYVQAAEGKVFDGPSIVAAFAAVNMRFGEMSIFHHFGVGNMHAIAPIFSAANMFEPGSFDLSSLNRFTTRGIAFFMRLPGAFEASLAFELMLNTVQRMARELHGEVLDDTRAILGSHSIEQLRALVKQYDRA
ncbi:MAG: cell division protein ZipA [Gammaproteobacteria bacterium]